jgi:hypothetical protein
MRFHPSSVQRSAEWGTTGSGQPAPEDGEAAWYWSAAPALGLGPASDVPLSWVPGLGAAEKRSTTWRGRGWRLSKVGDASLCTHVETLLTCVTVKTCLDGLFLIVWGGAATPRAREWGEEHGAAQDGADVVPPHWRRPR